ncbi:MAG: PorT family protein [Schleiferiaceae bacterium]|jgi:hypothetical protein|nr:PorT family protein [Schleiferiaceae bacterium]
MKNYKYFFVSLFLFGILSSNAQNEEEDFRIGFRAGWHSANMYRVGNKAHDNLEAFYLGFFSETKVSESFRMNSGLEYFQNGFTNSESSFRMHTLSLPATGKVFVGPVYGMAGLAFNFKLTDNREDFPGGEQSTTKITDTKFFDIPLSLGLGVQLGRIQVEAKYSWGLFNAGFIDGQAHKNRYLQVGAGILL